ncbi:MAG TPA: hypothetical protein VN476_18745 [Pyrinomonadaceae bacterium]|nr:hypothetical protein [Pyrinomonadaceae bacterium]
MKNKYLLASLSLIVALSLIGVRAQQPTNDEARIRQYQSDIQKMLAFAPPGGSKAESTFNAELQKLRSQLRDLLLEKRGAYKSRITNLQASSSGPEIKNYVAALQSELQDVNSQIAGIESSLAQAGTMVVVIQPSPTATPTPAPIPTPTNAQKDFEATVAALAATDLSKSAVPEVAKNALPERPCAAVLANPLGASKFDAGICGMASEIVNNRARKAILLRQDKGDLFPILVAKLLKANSNESFVTFVTEATEARTDQQVGAGPGSQGTTSLVVKGGVPYLFGLAVENGAATQSQSDTTITYRVNPAGAINLLGKKGFITGFQQDQSDPFMKFLGKTSLGFTFDTSRGNQPGVFTGDKQQLSAFSARVEFVNDRDPRLKKYERAWESFVATEMVKLSNVISATSFALNDWGTTTTPESFKDPALQAWLEQTNIAISSAFSNASAGDRVEIVATVIRQRADLLPVDLVSNETKAALINFARQYSEYTQKKNDLLKRIASGKIFTLEYTNSRATNAPDTSNFNFIAATGPGGKVDLTANGSLTFFNKVPAATALVPKPGRIRDFQFAGQVTVPFKFGESQFDFWFSGRYERLVENASTVAGTIIPGTKGDIAVGQFGLNIPIKSLGIKFPVSVTFANRTELIKEKEVRGNIGFTFNWDTLFSRLKPF